jgi:hypothetical protein
MGYQSGHSYNVRLHIRAACVPCTGSRGKVAEMAPATAEILGQCPGNHVLPASGTCTFNAEGMFE